MRYSKNPFRLNNRVACIPHWAKPTNLVFILAVILFTSILWDLGGDAIRVHSRLIRWEDVFNESLYLFQNNW